MRTKESKQKQKKIVLEDIRHSKGIYPKERQACDIATLMIGWGMSQKEAYEIVKIRYK